MSREQLVQMLRNDIRHAKAGTLDLVPEIARVPAERYLDPDRFEREVELVWRRMPLMLALSVELAGPDTYKAMEAAGVPVVIVRGQAGGVRAFVNMCSHRGAQIVPHGHGSARRFVCPYHGWAYDQAGALVGVAAETQFGELDRSCHGLVELPSVERAGFIWVMVKPEAALSIDTFLCGYDELLAHFGFESWHLVSQGQVEGPNWKIAYDGYLDFYHLPVLHKDTFGPNMPNVANYYAWGPHQRVSAPARMLAALDGTDEAEWSDTLLMNGVWTIFPHVSIASFDAGGRGVLISQLFPGREPQSSVTMQSYLMEHEPDAEQRAQAQEQIELLDYVVRQEDYATGLLQQQALATGLRQHVLFGRNEGGGQRFHAWLDRLLVLSDDELEAAFAAPDSHV